MCNLLHVTRCNFLCNNCRLSDVMENIHDVPHHFCLTNRLFSITLKNLQSLHKKIAARCVQQLRMKPRHRAAFSFNARKSVHYGRCPVRCGVGISLLPPTASPWPIRPTHTHTHTHSLIPHVLGFSHQTKHPPRHITTRCWFRFHHHQSRRDRITPSTSVASFAVFRRPPANMG